MKIIPVLAAVSLGLPVFLPGQSRPVDWPSVGGDARRTGWERSDTRITKENVKDFQLVLKRKLESQPSGNRSLSPPVVIGNLISYRGFKELGFVQGSSGGIWSIDLDIDRMFWQKSLAASSPKSGSNDVCSSGLTAVPALTPPVTFGGRGRPPVVRGTSTPPGTPVSPGIPPTPAGRSTALPARLGGGGFGGPRPLYVLATDGQLRHFNTSDGSDQFPPLTFLPPNSRASALTMSDYNIYATTTGNCGGKPNAVWGIDLAMEEPAVSSFPLEGSEAAGLSGFAVGNNGTVYVQTTGVGSKYANRLLALNSRSLQLKGNFSTAASGGGTSPGRNLVTPVVFEFGGRDVVVTAGANGRLYVVDSSSLGGGDGKTALAESPVIAGSGDAGIWGGITTWEDIDGIRWLAVPVWGALSPDFKAPVTNGAISNGAVVGFRVEDANGKPVLTPAWVSRDMTSPQPPVTTGGIVFALSSGGKTGSATMYALDGATGKDMYSTKNQVTAPANLTGMSLANGRIFFTTTDGTLYGFGVYLER